MKQASIVAAAVATSNANPNNCCSSKKGMGLAPVTKDWLCGEFRSTFERNNTQCKADIASFFEDLNEPIPASRHNIDQVRTEEHIRKWFNFYCGAKTFDFEAEKRVFEKKQKKTKEERQALRHIREEREKKEGRNDTTFVNTCQLKKE
jgi:hypothetical protein